MDERANRCDRKVDMGRRWFLGGAGVAAAGAAAASVVPQRAKAEPQLARVAYPSNRLANVKQLKSNEPLAVAYPDADAPGVLIKLGTKVPGGVGPDGDIVGFTTICPHKGFPMSYNASDRTLNCPGHYSRFDCENGGQQIWGHATANLAQYLLRVDSTGDIYANGLDELLYGRLSNVLEG
ncbi:MAG TPA: arsenate reductase (azurin) small subunit [Roseiarcus sp.]|nr:arsenate reductase (azurin) small subunit [Roseiarcus sp.]